MEAVLEIEKDYQPENKKQIVIFQLGTEEYAVDITHSREIIKPTKITKVPNTPDYVRGVINLRGQIVPVIDLRKRFNIIVGTADKKKERIITIESRETLVGLVVDSVNEVFWLNLTELEPAPEIEGGIKQEFIQGVGKKDDRLLVLIDMERLLFAERETESEIM